MLRHRVDVCGCEGGVGARARRGQCRLAVALPGGGGERAAEVSGEAVAGHGQQEQAGHQCGLHLVRF